MTMNSEYSYTDEIEKDEGYVSIEEASELLQKEFIAYLSGERGQSVLAVALAPGGGKSYQAVRLAEKLALGGKNILYLVPQHSLWTTIIEMAQYPHFWQHWHPRRCGPNGEFDPITTCRHSDAISIWLKKGFDSGTFCQQLCGYHYMQNTCPYYEQGRMTPTPPIVFGTHELLRGMMNIKRFDLVIVDEDPTHVFYNQRLIPTKNIMYRGLDPMNPFTHLLHEVQELSKKKIRASGRGLISELGGWEIVLSCCDEAGSLDELSSYQPRLRHPSDVEEAPHQFISQFIFLLRQLAEAVRDGIKPIRRIYVDENGLTLLSQARLAQHVLENKLIIMDGTANEAILNELFHPRPVHFFKPKIRQQGRIYQFYNGLYGITNVYNEEAEKKVFSKEYEDGKRAIQAIIRKKEYTTWCGISHKAVVNDDQSPFEFANNSGNFATVGSNQFMADGLFVMGTPQPSHGDLIRYASMIFFRRIEEFDSTWTTQKNDRGLRVSHFSDDDLNAVLHLMRESKIVQAINRARPFRRISDIFLFSDIDLSYTEIRTELTTIHDVLEAPQGVANAVKWYESRIIAHVIIDEHGACKATDLMAALDCSKPIALSIMRALNIDATTNIRMIEGKGRQPACLVRRNADYYLMSS